MQGAHLIWSVNGARRFSSKLSDQSKISLRQWLIRQCSLKFIHVLSSKCWARESRKDISTWPVLFTQSSKKTAREGQMFSAQPKVINTWGRHGLPMCVHKHMFPTHFVLCCEWIQCWKLEPNFKLAVERSPLKQDNPATWSMTLLAMQHHTTFCDIHFIQNRGNFYCFKPQINTYITTVPEWISWDAASCFQWSPEMTAKE